MQTKKDTNITLESLLYLPAFAQYLLTHRLNDMAELYAKLIQEMAPPMMRFLKNQTAEELSIISKKNTVDLLSHLSQNRGRQYIEAGVQRWKTDQLPVLGKDDVVAQDITLVTYIRKKCFLYFLPDYSSETEQVIELIREIDFFLLEGETAATNFYINLLKERIDDHTNFIEKITNTSPGIIYVYDVIHNKELYANRATTDFLGYKPEEITSMGSEFVETLIHPDDIATLKAYEQSFKTTRDGEVRSFKYRIKNNKGDYRWLRTYETVFKRNHLGQITEKIGIAIDIHQQKLTADELHKREAELLEAQEIAQLGSFTWDFEGKNSQSSPQTKKILELDSDDHQTFMQRVHRDDKKKMEEAILESMSTGKYECEYRYLGKKEEKTIWTRGIVNYHDGKPVSMHGTVMDITEKQKLVQKLQENESLYKQAEALSHLGNYSWNLDTNEIKWSDELYRIHGLEPQSTAASGDFVYSFIHPDDKVFVEKEIQNALDKKQPFDFNYRIDTREGKLKILHARGEIKCDDMGTPRCIIGTEEDVTEKQTLIKKLSHDAEVYKQAEALANIGSWTWDLKTNEIEWTDQMYHIYGLEPQSEKITFERYFQFVLPEDHAKINSARKSIYEQKFSDHSFRIITSQGKIKSLHTLARLYTDEGGNPSYVVGAEQDITENERLLQRLKKSENIYRQAEELSNMGNWNWNLKTNKLEWTDQLYKIYGLAPQSEEITIERFLAFVHPEDKEQVSAGITKMYTEKDLDYTFRIITADGRVKVIRSVAHAETDEKGMPVFVIGSERDITEKQNLIDSLKKSESLYKQAQSLAKIGNFVWDIANDEVSWSDEVYKIYGLPVDTAISFNTTFEPILPAHKIKVHEAIQQTIQDKKGRGVSYAIRQQSGHVKHIKLETDVLLDKTGNVSKIIGTAQDVTEHQLLIEKLQKSEQLYKQAQTLANIGNWSWEIDTGKVEWSEQLYNIYEVPYGEEISYEKVASFMHPEDKEPTLTYLQECLQTGKTYDKPHRIILRNGKHKTIHRRAEVIMENRKPVKMIGTTQDITEIYRVQQELKDNQTFIRKITDATPSIIASYNVNTGNYVFISEGLEKLLGYDIKQAMEKGIAFFLGIIHPEDLAEISEKNSNVLQEANANPDKNDMVVDFTYRMRHKNGKYRWFHTYGTIFDRNSEGKVEHILNISLDITDQKEATQKIAEQEHFIQQIADASPTILYLYDVDTQSVVYINREIFFVLGYLPDEIVETGENITAILYHPDDYYLLPARKQSAKNFQQVDSMMQYECRLKSKDGDWRWFLVREIVFKTDEKGNIRQILGAALDINRRKEMERTILQNTMLLEQSNASLEEFAYVASHDLKEPLRKISTFGDRLVASQMDTLTPEGKIYLKKIVDASQRMQMMISDLLSISMITGNRSFELHSLQKILDETLQTLEFKIEQQNATIQFDPLPEARIIPSQFRQLFQNLLSNSLKFVKDGMQPMITIKYSSVTENESGHYQLAEASQYHKIEIADNGIGFENEFAGKIFAIFQRLHGRSEYEGSGIGLAICKKIVEHHGGIIYANGIPDAGATFTIILPA